VSSHDASAHRGNRCGGGIVVAAAIPVLIIVWSIAQPSTDVWRLLWATRLPGMLTATATTLVTVLAGTLVFGTGLAWLVTAYRFLGHHILGHHISLCADCSRTRASSPPFARRSILATTSPWSSTP
jgi:ABC-type sulfate transport system permease component